MLTETAASPRSAARLAALLLAAAGATAVAAAFLLPTGRDALRNSDAVVGILLFALGAYAYVAASEGRPGKAFGACLVAALLSAWLALSPLLLRVALPPAAAGALLAGTVGIVCSLYLLFAGLGDDREPDLYLKA